MATLAEIKAYGVSHPELSDNILRGMLLKAEDLNKPQANFKLDNSIGMKADNISAGEPESFLKQVYNKISNLPYGDGPEAIGEKQGPTNLADLAEPPMLAASLLAMEPIIGAGSLAAAGQAALPLARGAIGSYAGSRIGKYAGNALGAPELGEGAGALLGGIGGVKGVKIPGRYGMLQGLLSKSENVPESSLWSRVKGEFSNYDRPIPEMLEGPKISKSTGNPYADTPIEAKFQDYLQNKNPQQDLVSQIGQTKNTPTSLESLLRNKQEGNPIEALFAHLKEAPEEEAPLTPPKAIARPKTNNQPVPNPVMEQLMGKVQEQLKTALESKNPQAIAQAQDRIAKLRMLSNNSDNGLF